MLTVYLAGPYAARPNLARHASELRYMGFNVQCRWLDETHDITDGTVGAAVDLDDATAAGHARDDLADVDQADILVAFTADASGVPVPFLLFGSSGGRHVETGYALARGKQVVVVGAPENIFHRLRDVLVVPNWHEAVVHLARMLVDAERDAPREAVG